MEVKKDQINKAIEICEKEGANVRYSGAVLKIHDTKKGSAKRILILTNFFITYFKIGSKPLEDRKNYWRDVSSFNYEDKRIELYFKCSPFRFISDNSDEIFDIIMEIFLRCFTPDELSPLDLSRFAHPPIKVNGCGILNRYSIILASNNIEQDQNELETLKAFAKYSNPYFEINPSSKYAGPILETIRAAPYLNTIIFQKANETKHLYKLISNFLRKTSNVHMISLNNRPDINFSKLSSIKTTSSKDQTNILALKFTNVEIEEDDLERISEFIKSADIESLSLCNSLPSYALQKFTFDFLPSESTSKLAYLNLDGVKRLKINDVIANLQNISVLSLKGCNLQISKVLMALTKSKNQSLRYLNLSHNKCTYNLKKFRLPPYLERIDLNKVEWKNSTLPRFLTQLFDQQLNEGLKLFINKIIIDDNEWESVFNTFESIIKYPLIELSWNHNKLSSQLFNFLSKNTKISTLFINGCFKCTNTEEILHFAQILPNLTNLTHLIIKGDSESYVLKEKAGILFENIKQMNSISYIDFSNNLISTEGVEGLANLINVCNRLTYLSFDGSEIDDSSSFEKLIDEGEKRKKPLYISWPEIDLRQLKEKSKITEANIQVYIEKLNRLTTGISNARTNAIRSSMQYMSNMSSRSKSTRMSMRMLKTENSVALKEKKNARSRSTVRDIRTASFRGVKRPNLLVPEKLHMEFDPNSPLNKIIEVYQSHFTHKFPRYYTQNLKNLFTCNPINIHELDDISFSTEDMNEESNNETGNNYSDLSSRSTKNSSKRSIDIQGIVDDDEEEEIIELALLNDPEIPPIKPLSLPKSIYRYTNQSKNQSNSQLLTKLLNLPKLEIYTNNEEYNEVDRSSLRINDETNELEMFKSKIKIDEISDFSSSEPLEDDSEGNIDDIKVLMNKLKEETDILAEN